MGRRRHRSNRHMAIVCGQRTREIIGTFGPTTVAVPHARLRTADGGTTGGRNKTLTAHRHRTRPVDAMIAAAYLAGTNTRRVSRALASLFGGVVSKSTVSRVWRKIKADWEAWTARDLSHEDVVRLILDGNVVKARLDRKATAITLLVALGVRRRSAMRSRQLFIVIPIVRVDAALHKHPRCVRPWELRLSYAVFLPHRQAHYSGSAEIAPLSSGASAVNWGARNYR